MPTITHRGTALLVTLAAAAALGIALASERWGGLVPCALCLLERWPYRAAIILGLAAAISPPRLGYAFLILAFFALLVAAGLAFVHVGVEQTWWPSPLPECAAPRLGSGSISERLAHMPARPAKPCDEPTYLIPFLPISMAAMNLVYAGALAFALAAFLLTRRGNAR